MQNLLNQIQFFAWIQNSFIISHLLEWLKVLKIKNGIRVNFDQCDYYSMLSHAQSFLEWEWIIFEVALDFYSILLCFNLKVSKQKSETNYSQSNFIWKFLRNCEIYRCDFIKYVASMCYFCWDSKKLGNCVLSILALLNLLIW